MNRDNILKNIFIFSSGYGVSKEANLIEVNGVIYYHFGSWKNDQLINGITLTTDEAHRLIERIRIVNRSELTEIERFQYDLIQQSHNGSVFEKEIIDK